MSKYSPFKMGGRLFEKIYTDKRAYRDRPFERACSEGNLDVVEAGIRRDPKLASNEFGLTLAIINGRLKVLEYLIEARGGIDIAEIGNLPLRVAALNNHIDVLNYLREMAGDKWKCHECLIKSTCLELCSTFRTERNNHVE